MRKLLTAGVILGVTAMQNSRRCLSTAVGQSATNRLPYSYPVAGRIRRPITTDSDLAQQFFDHIAHGVEFYRVDCLVSRSEPPRSRQSYAYFASACCGPQS